MKTFNFLNEKFLQMFTTYKGRYTDTVQRYHTYKKTEHGMPINDTSTITKNKIFDVTVKHDSHGNDYKLSQPKNLQYALSRNVNRTHIAQVT